MSFISIIICLLVLPTINQATACDDLSAFNQLMAGPPRSRYEYRGRYVNEAYEYSVRIPKGFTGYDGRKEANHNGFGLALGKVSQGVIFVIAEHNSLEYNMPREAAVQTVEWLRQRGKQIESETISDTHLGKLRAVHLVVIYTCRGSTDRYVQSSIMALSPDLGFTYTLELYSPANHYASNRRMLDQVVKSWKMIGRSQQLRK